MNYSQIMSPVPLCLEKCGGGVMTPQLQWERRPCMFVRFVNSGYTLVIRYPDKRYTCTYAGKTYTMLGVDDSPTSLGVIPCAIDWLFRLINDQKEQTGARFSVRVSAVEITGKQEHLKDLLAETASGKIR